MANLAALGSALLEVDTAFKGTYDEMGLGSGVIPNYKGTDTFSGAQRFGVLAHQSMANMANSTYTAMGLGGAGIGAVYGGITGGLSDSDTAISKGLSDGIAGGMIGTGARFGAKRYAEGAVAAFSKSMPGSVPTDLAGIKKLDGFMTKVDGKFQVAHQELATSIAAGGNGGFSFSHFGHGISGVNK